MQVNTNDDSLAIRKCTGLLNSGMAQICNSGGSTGRVRGGGKKHEIYEATFSGHLFYYLFSQGQRGAMAPSPPDPLLCNLIYMQ